MRTHITTSRDRITAIHGLSTAPPLLNILLLILAPICLGYIYQPHAFAQSTSIDLQLLSTSIAADTSGNIYYVDTAHSAVYKYSASGTATLVNCCTGLVPSALANPRGVALDATGDLYVADTGNNRIVEISAAGNFSVVDTQLYQLSIPSGIAVDTSGDLYIADSANNRIVEVNTLGQPFQVSTGNYTLSSPLGMAVDQAGDLYISDTNNNRIIKVSSSGSATALMSNAVNSPLSIASDNYGNAYIGQLGAASSDSSQNTGIPAVVASFQKSNVNLKQGTGSQIPVSTMKVTLTPDGGFNDTLSLEVLGLPPNVLADFSPVNVVLNGNTKVVETIMLGIRNPSQSAYLMKPGKAIRSANAPNAMPLLASMAPISLLCLVGLRRTRKTLGRPLHLIGLFIILLMLPTMVAMTSGCAGGYPAGLIGNDTYTATLVARSTTGNALYQLGSFGITIQ